MREPELTAKAKDDVRDIWYSVASKGDERAADRLISQILEKCRSRARFPETGRLRDEISPGLRSFPVPPYVVFFRPLEDTILVLRIIHGRRDLKRFAFDE